MKQGARGEEQVNRHKQEARRKGFLLPLAPRPLLLLGELVQTEHDGQSEA